MTLKRFIPSSIKRVLRILLRKTRDRLAGDTRRFSRQTDTTEAFKHHISISQNINKNESYRNKIHNLNIAIGKLQYRPVNPGELFSFWHCVGEPNRKRGYQKSRSLVQGGLREEYGGGLCQLSGIIYLLALKSGLNIIERHPHSVDIYAEDERYAPLGADATVVYGYKDLRIENSLTCPVYFQFSITDQCLVGSLFSRDVIKTYEMEFDRHRRADGELVISYRLKCGNKLEVTRSFYTTLSKTVAN